MPTRLKGTKSLFANSINTSRVVFLRITSSVDTTLVALKALSNELKASQTPSNCIETSKKLINLVQPLSYNPEPTDNKDILLTQIKEHIRAENAVRHAATENAIVAMYTAFEDFIRQLMTKYYEDDIRRMLGLDKTLKIRRLLNRSLMEVLLSGTLRIVTLTT